MNIFKRWSAASILLLFATLFAGCTTLNSVPGQVSKPAAPTLGVRLRVEAAETHPSTSQLSRSHVLRVVEVKPQQSARFAGIETGDILLSLNGVPISGMADSLAILQAAQWGDVLTAQVLRGDQSLTIPVLLKRKNHNAEDVHQTSTQNPAVTDTIAPEVSLTVTERAALPAEPQPAKFATDAAQVRVATVVARSAIVRMAATTDSGIVISLRQGATVALVEKAGNWYSIVTRDGRNIAGFMHASLLAL